MNLSSLFVSSRSSKVPFRCAKCSSSLGSLYPFISYFCPHSFSMPRFPLFFLEMGKVTCSPSSPGKGGRENRSQGFQSLFRSTHFRVLCCLWSCFSPIPIGFWPCFTLAIVAACKDLSRNWIRFCRDDCKKTRNNGRFFLPREIRKPSAVSNSTREALSPFH